MTSVHLSDDKVPHEAEKSWISAFALTAMRYGLGQRIGEEIGALNKTMSE
jgi:hypothetical protein